MLSMTHQVSAVNAVVEVAPTIPTENPRDTWGPDTDADTWTITKEDDYRPTAGPDFLPTSEEDTEWSETLAIEEEMAYDAWLEERARDRHQEAFLMACPRESDGFRPGYYS